MNALDETLFHFSELVGKTIFNHDIMHCTSDDVVGNQYYSGRALCLTQPGDFIQMHPHISSEWPYITEHYDRIGLYYSTNAIWDTSYRYFMENPDYAASVFFYSTSVDMVVHNKSWYEVVSYINSKNNFMALAEQLNLDVPQTHCFDGKGKLGDLKALPYPCYAKAAISVSGTGIFRCADENELREALKQFEPETPIQIQQEVNTNQFLNVQYEVIDKKLHRLAITEQVLKGFAHQGNRYPASYEPWDSVEPMAEWMLEEGMQGIFAFDVGVVESEHGMRFMPIECNPRYNGASYPTAVANKLGIKQWIALNMDTSIQSLADIDLSGIEYDPQTGEGVVIFNWGCVQAGKLGVLIAGDRHTQKGFTNELQKRLCLLQAS